MSWLSAFGLILVTLLSGMLLAGAARRTLDEPVGWVRSIATTLLVFGIGTALLEPGTDALSVDVTNTGEALGFLLIVLVAWAWMFAVALGALLVLEVLVPTGRLPTPLQAWRGMRDGRQESRRYGQVVAILVRRGLGGFLRRGAGGEPDRSAGALAAHARSLRLALSDAGVTYVKFGQMLSSRRDLVPDVVADELSRLQARVPPESWETVRTAVTDALGRSPGEVFARFDESPLASASVGQVHGARLHDGREVVVKVLRPGARSQVEVDLRILGRLARKLERDTQWARSLGVVGLVAGFAASLREELDYTVELANTLNLDRALAATPGGVDPRVQLPTLRPELSGPTLLVMDRMEGVPLGEAADVLAAIDPAERRLMAQSLLGSAMRQLVVTGVFHADLHPGNILVRPDGTLGLLDLGAVGRMDESERTALGAFLLAVQGDDSIAALDALRELLVQPDHLDARDVERRLGAIIVRFRHGTGPGGSGELFGTMIGLFADAGMTVPPGPASALRTMASLEGALALLAPGFDLVAAAQEVGASLLTSSMGPRAVRDRVTRQLAGMAPTLQRLPRRLTQVVEDLQDGRLTVTVRSFAHPEDRRFVTSLVQQLVTAVIAAASLVGAVLMIVSPTGPVLLPGIDLYWVLGAGLAFIGTLLSVRVLVFALRSRR
ncbi:ABC1 kinase family protein [Isoptericola sediminis]|uniref:AarF/ABC1/UbiB kinase family protein n=1 Tax=Isoptericola sediminis TaxID=2733572 RepID=A0A849K4T1_9MICO|nr:AarF/UbiB family protein [Isoptericola sediminis]NNU26157.1 AarF/ABC1/UbiB kinase family protein [Isoptericola sediminis]